MMKRFFSVIIAAALTLLPVAYGEEGAPGLYAFFNGAPKGDLVDEALFLKQSGYAGISQLYSSELGEKLTKRVEIYEKAGLKVLSVYLPATEVPIKEETVKALANRGSLIELTVQKKIDDKIIESIRKTAAMADRLKIRVALYPHTGFAVATVPQAIDLIAKVNHPNLGMMFNLCHFLKNEKEADLESVLEKAGDRLFAVSINGADLNGKGWGGLIQTLDKGTFPQKRLFKQLEKVGFSGPLSLQCYGIKGDRKENLKKSIGAFTKLWE
ncbi:MAG: sugar phosphate isomerase/epimerase family protein [Akkermansiaceae bacterium]